MDASWPWPTCRSTSDGCDVREDNVDPAVALAALGRAQSTARADLFLDAGPWWQVPATAVMFTSFALFFSGDFPLGSVVGPLISAVISFHEVRSRRIEPLAGARLGRRRLMSNLIALGTAAAYWVVAVLRPEWLGFELAPVGAIVGFAFTVAVFSVQRLMLKRRRVQLVGS